MCCTVMTNPECYYYAFQMPGHEPYHTNYFDSDFHSKTKYYTRQGNVYVHMCMCVELPFPLSPTLFLSSHTSWQGAGCRGTYTCSFTSHTFYILCPYTYRHWHEATFMNKPKLREFDITCFVKKKQNKSTQNAIQHFSFSFSVKAIFYAAKCQLVLFLFFRLFVITTH